jgi:transcriptional regulator with XRE-family HTH domain
MTPASLTAWRTRLRLNKSEAATALGIARSTLDRYLDGSVKIPPPIALACVAVEHLGADLLPHPAPNAPAPAVSPLKTKRKI